MSARYFLRPGVPRTLPVRRRATNAPDRRSHIGASGNLGELEGANLVKNDLRGNVPDLRAYKAFRYLRQRSEPQLGSARENKVLNDILNVP